MYLVAVFKSSLSLDLAISDLLKNGLNKDNILTVPLEQKTGGSNGNSVVDSAAVLGAALMVLGVIYGFVLAWGPIIWGLIALLAGAAAGALLALARGRMHSNKSPKSTMAEVVLVINYRGNNVEAYEQILWNNQALGMGRLER